MAENSRHGDIEIPDYLPLSGPYVTFFLLCDYVLQEADGTFSYIRAVDLWTATTPKPPFFLSCSVAIGMRGFSEEPSHHQGFLILYKDGDEANRQYVLKSALNISIDSPGLNLNTSLSAIQIDSFGLYTFAFILDGRELSAVKIEIVPPVETDQTDQS